VSKRDFGFLAYYQIDPLSKHFHLSLAVGIHPFALIGNAYSSSQGIIKFCFNVQNPQMHATSVMRAITVI